jgi:hypothetical protein
LCRSRASCDSSSRGTWRVSLDIALRPRSQTLGLPNTWARQRLGLAGPVGKRARATNVHGGARHGLFAQCSSAEVQCGSSSAATRSAGQNSPAENATARLAGSCQLCPARESEMRCAAMSAAAAAAYRHNTTAQAPRLSLFARAPVVPKVGLIVLRPSTARCARAQDEALFFSPITTDPHPEQRHDEAVARVEGRRAPMQ